MTVMDWLLAGFSATLLFLGPSSSGKTYTAIGDCRASASAGITAGHGILPRLLDSLLRSSASSTLQVGIAAVSIAGGRKTDLIDHGKRELQPSEAPTVAVIETIAQALDVLRVASSRAPSDAHLLFQVFVFNKSEGVGGVLSLFDLKGLDAPGHDSEVQSLEKLLSGIAIAGQDWPVASQAAAESLLNSAVMPLLTGNSRIFLVGTVIDSTRAEATNKRLMKLLSSCLCLSNRCSKITNVSWSSLISSAAGVKSSASSTVFTTSVIKSQSAAQEPKYVSNASQTSYNPFAATATSTAAHRQSVHKAQPSESKRTIPPPDLHSAASTVDQRDNDSMSSHSTRYKELTQSFADASFESEVDVNPQPEQRSSNPFLHSSPGRFRHQIGSSAESVDTFQHASSVSSHQDVTAHLQYLDKEIASQKSVLRSWQSKVGSHDIFSCSQ